MRIALLSAHYPPDFVSGGTLQPQRIAQRLVGLGHEVRVLAGSLDPDRTPLSTWDTTDEAGVVVRWVAIGPFIGWDDPLNHDNPGVRAVAEAWLAEWEPEVVHGHALQGLGVGPLEAAADRGIPVVVTMHDFWWVCARQFLVDTDLRPCPVVVEASACECQAGRAHLRARDRRLRAALDRVSQVLVPSEAAARVLAANGVAPGRLAVDENGVDAPAPALRSPHWDARAPGDPVVVRYAGGGNALKGPDVLLDALRRLPADLPLRVIAHGIDDAVARADASPTGLRVEAVAPYSPSELQAVLDDTDVLVLPSVMRETFSILTREALTRGVPVIATDVLGPEEVVRHDHNGLILPAGDVDALAAALRRIAEDPTVVGRWRASTGAVSLRSVDDQARGLVTRFAALQAPAPSPSPSVVPPWLERVLFVVGIDGAPLRYRAQLPAEALALLGVDSQIRHYRDPDLAEAAATASVVVVYRVPATPQVLARLGDARARGVPVAFDVDDLIFDPTLRGGIPALRALDGPEAALWMEGVRRYRTTLEACDAYVGSTAGLVSHAEATTGIPSFLFENGVGALVGAQSDLALRRARTPGPLRVGYLSGTTSHDEDWASVEAVVVEVLEDRPDVELWLGGHLQPGPLAARLGGRVRRLPFVPWQELPAILRDLDVNLAPLTGGSRFNDAKSAIKWLEAALCRTPTLASASQPFRDAIGHGVTGWLADDAEGWRAGLEALLDDAELRREIGARAQRDALLRWAPHQQAERYVQVLERVREASTRHRVPDPAWVPEVRDEPALAHRTLLTPYALEPGAPTTPRRPDGRGAEWSGTARRAWASLRTDGARVTVARSGRSLRHRWALRRARTGRG